jgi:hypothetical protein
VSFSRPAAANLQPTRRPRRTHWRRHQRVEDGRPTDKARIADGSSPSAGPP